MSLSVCINNDRSDKISDNAVQSKTFSAEDPSALPNEAQLSTARVSYLDRRFGGGTSNSVHFVEIFAGSARLSSEFKKAKFSVISVDTGTGKFSPESKIFPLDLLREDAQRIVTDICSAAQFVWLAPPCGTASRAREIGGRGQQSGPQQLRSDLFPEGLSDLSPEDKVRVDRANSLYKVTAVWATDAVTRAAFFVIENPHRSYAWHFFRQVQKMTGVFTVDFDACMFGGERPKRTRLLTNCPSLKNLGVLCDGLHQHTHHGLRAVLRYPKEVGRLALRPYIQELFVAVWCS